MRRNYKSFNLCHVSTRRSTFNCYYPTARAATSRLLSSYLARSNVSGHHHGGIIRSAIMRDGPLLTAERRPSVCTSVVIRCCAQFGTHRTDQLDQSTLTVWGGRNRAMAFTLVEAYCMANSTSYAVLEPGPPSTERHQPLLIVLLLVHPHHDDRASASLHAIKLHSSYYY